jgi:hypothetical protein
MTEPCPYTRQPPRARWRATVGAAPRGTVDPTSGAGFRIDPATRIVSAGSCFAQHVRAQVVRRGFTYLIAEPAPAGMSADDAAERGYGLYSARYANVYSAPQLAQLFERAYGRFEPVEEAWRDGDRYVDPFRPFVEPDGFASLAELRADRERHLAAVRRAFEQAEVFAFTLGLTETWRSRRDGSVYPVCPGCGVAAYDPSAVEFVNLDVAQTVDALNAFLAGLARVNPGARTILTVSPVPLLATMTDRHVVEASTYSKSVLRVAAETVAAAHPAVDYFPAYEIVTATHRTHEYFAGDGRTVTPAGVNRVMDLFFQTYAGLPAPAAAAAASAVPARDDVVCDEETALAILDAPGSA